MQRYFAKDKINDKLYLEDGDYHHIKNVMRNNIGDNIEVAYDNIIYICQIKNVSPLELEIISSVTEDREMKTDLTIALSLVNEQKMDLILQHQIKI